jgi:hypothetical protein
MNILHLLFRTSAFKNFNPLVQAQKSKAANTFPSKYYMTSASTKPGCPQCFMSHDKANFRLFYVNSGHAMALKRHAAFG